VRRWVISLAAIVAVVALAFAVALLGLNESPWSLRQALLGHLGPASANVEATKIRAALLANDPAIWARISPVTPHDILRATAESSIRTVRLTNVPMTPAPNNPDNAWTWSEVNGTRVGFAMTKGRLTGWRVESYHISP
jgi:hypothetical protein